MRMFTGRLLFPHYFLPYGLPVYKTRVKTVESFYFTVSADLYMCIKLYSEHSDVPEHIVYLQCRSLQMFVIPCPWTRLPA